MCVRARVCCIILLQAICVYDIKEESRRGDFSLKTSFLRFPHKICLMQNVTEILCGGKEDSLSLFFLPAERLNFVCLHSSFRDIRRHEVITRRDEIRPVARRPYHLMNKANVAGNTLKPLVSGSAFCSSTASLQESNPVFPSNFPLTFPIKADKQQQTHQYSSSLFLYIPGV